MPRHLSLGITLVIVLGAACSPDGEAEATASVERDSAGFAVVTNARPEWGDRSDWAIDTVPMFTIADGQASSETSFQRLLNVYRLSDGSVVVFDMAPPFVRAFKSDGSVSWTAVPRGEGPGEIRDPALLSRIRGDSLIVEDARSARSFVLSSDGRIAGELPSRLVNAPGDEAAQRLLYPAVRLRDGSLFGYSPSFSREDMMGSGIVVPRWPAYLQSRDGSSVKELGAWPFLATAQRDAPAVHVVFGARAALAVAPDGFVYGFPETDELRLFGADGNLRTLLRTPGSRRVATDPEIAAGRRVVAYAMTNPRRATLIADQLLVDSLPAFGRVVVGTDGTIWRERFDPYAPPAVAGLARTDAGATWDVHDASGVWLGAVTMPRAFYLADAGDDWVAGIHTAPDDVQIPRVYRLRR